MKVQELWKAKAFGLNKGEAKMRYAIGYTFEGNGVIFVDADNDNDALEIAEEQLEDEDEIIDNRRIVTVESYEIEEVEE